MFTFLNICLLNKSLCWLEVVLFIGANLEHFLDKKNSFKALHHDRQVPLALSYRNIFFVDVLQGNYFLVEYLFR